MLKGQPTMKSPDIRSANSTRAGQYVTQPTGYRAFIPAPQPPTQSPTQSSESVTRLLVVLEQGARSPEELRQALRIKHRPTFRENYIHPALQQGFIEVTIPAKPTSRFQKYRLTGKGRAWLATQSNKGDQP